jgi:D-Tyr-tRNAtyr deacylase
MAEEIKIVASAVGFDQVQKGLNNTTSALKTTADQAQKTGQTLNSTLKPGAAQAGQSLVNLGRIAQDAPFGFIAIQNNISPLIESFGRLKSETGTTGGALKSLVQGLAGPAGLGLAVSVGTALLTTFAGELFKSKKAVEETDKALQSIVKSQAQELTQVGGLIAVLKNENESRERKNQALENLKKINPEIFNGLKLEEGAVIGLNSAYAAYIKNIETVVAAKVIQDKLEKLYVKLVEANGSALTKSQRAIAAAVTNGYKSQAAGLRQLGDEGANAARQLEKFGTSQEDLKNNKVKGLTNEIVGLEEQLTELSKGIKLTGDSSKKTAKEIETIDDVIAKLRKSIADEDILAGIFKTPRFDVIKKDFDLVKSAIETLVTKFNISPSDKRLLKLQIELGNLEGRLTPEQQIKDTINKIRVPDFVFKIKPRVDTDIKNLQTGLVQLGEKTAESVETIANDIAFAFGDTLGKAMTGEATFGDFFKGIFAVIGAGLQDLGKQFVLASKLFATIKKTLAARPELALIAGLALIAVGGAIRSLSSRNAFAVGTRNAPGGMALVGERGPELVNLPRGSQVIPAAQTSNMMGGFGGSVEVFGILRGQDIYFSNKKYSQTYGRTT